MTQKCRCHLLRFPLEDCWCQSGRLSRREFVRNVGLTTAAALFVSRLSSLAEDPAPPPLGELIPADKKLDPAWVRSLYERGVRDTYRGADLRYVGMPVGGIAAGQVYLSGDGNLWWWDIFNNIYDSGCGAPSYTRPYEPARLFEQGFAIRTTSQGRTEVRPLNKTGFADVAFTGEYPIGFVDYSDPASPVAVSLEAFSPFIPLDAAASALPATVMRYTVRNTGSAPVEVAIGGWLQNVVCFHTSRGLPGQRHNDIVRSPAVTFLNGTVENRPARQQPRPEIVFEDWKKTDFSGWTVEGTAFGSGPLDVKDTTLRQGTKGQAAEQRVANSLAPTKSDAGQGKLTSKPFTIDRDFITFWIAGGRFPNETAANLVVDGKVVRSLTGSRNDTLSPQTVDVRDLQGRQGVIEIVDATSKYFGQISVGTITFTDTPDEHGPLEKRADFGSMGLALFDPQPGDFASAGITGALPEALFNEADPPAKADADIDGNLIGGLGRKLSLAPGASATVSFAVVWYFPNVTLPGIKTAQGRYYGAKFASATAVAEHLGKNFRFLVDQTTLWHDTWYDSTLPYWFLDRTFASISTLATSTPYWLSDGRFYSWEGVGSCMGTCTHVWGYAQAVGRIFPELERDLRSRTDYGISFMPENGQIRYRAETSPPWPAVDGQAACVLRTYREHLMSADDAFLKAYWPKVRQALEFLIARDPKKNGILAGEQCNTLDSSWFGSIAWISSLYIAALRAGEEMAGEVGDKEFAATARGILDASRTAFPEEFWGGEYFINKVDPARLDSINSGTGSDIDQMMGQAWAYQVGLGRILPEDKTKQALQSLWKYNFAPDVGPYEKAYPKFRKYALPGESGMIMCTFPRDDWSFRQACGKNQSGLFAGYFNECWTGNEHQVAGHYLWEGMTDEGLILERAIHDRYRPSKRNPWNEVECGDHYSRALASYGAYIAACGFEYHGPKGRLAFAPRIHPEDFRAAFIAAQGWGTFAQHITGRALSATVAIMWGRLSLHTLGLELPAGAAPSRVTATLSGKPVAATVSVTGSKAGISLRDGIVLQVGETLSVDLA